MEWNGVIRHVYGSEETGKWETTFKDKMDHGLKQNRRNYRHVLRPGL
jgi:hypothetical protein